MRKRRIDTIAFFRPKKGRNLRNKKLFWFADEIAKLENCSHGEAVRKVFSRFAARYIASLKRQKRTV